MLVPSSLGHDTGYPLPSRARNRAFNILRARGNCWRETRRCEAVPAFGTIELSFTFFPGRQHLFRFQGKRMGKYFGDFYLCRGCSGQFSKFGTEPLPDVNANGFPTVQFRDQWRRGYFVAHIYPGPVPDRRNGNIVSAAGIGQPRGGEPEFFCDRRHRRRPYFLVKFRARQANPRSAHDFLLRLLIATKCIV